MHQGHADGSFPLLSHPQYPRKDAVNNDWRFCVNMENIRMSGGMARTGHHWSNLLFGSVLLATSFLVRPRNAIIQPLGLARIQRLPDYSLE